MIMRNKEKNSQIDKHKGKLIFKSKTARKFKRLLILGFIDLLALTGFIAAIYLFVNGWILFAFPNSLFPGIIYGLGMILFGFFFYISTLLILREFWTYLMVYEKGVEILVNHPLPFEYKREFIPYKNIVDVKIVIEDFGLETLYIYVKNKEPYELTEFEISDLQGARNLILKSIKL